MSGHWSGQADKPVLRPQNRKIEFNNGRKYKFYA